MLPYPRSFWILVILILLGITNATKEEQLTERNHKKRQIYREQVLPHAGGKIPDTAFETDRLFLNRLQKEGIAVPDGIVPEQRSPQVYQYYKKPTRTVFHIALSSDGRYTPREGRYHYWQVPTVETTYLYPQVVGRSHVLVPPKHALPHYRQFQLHNPLLNQVKFQPKKNPNFLDLTHTVVGGGGVGGGNGKSHVNSYKAESYQNVNLLHEPLMLQPFKKTPTATGRKTYKDSYGITHLFSEFDDLLNQLDLHHTSQAYN